MSVNIKTAMEQAMEQATYNAPANRVSDKIKTLVKEEQLVKEPEVFDTVEYSETVTFRLPTHVIDKLSAIRTELSSNIDKVFTMDETIAYILMLYVQRGEQQTMVKPEVVDQSEYVSVNTDSVFTPMAFKEPVPKPVHPAIEERGGDFEFEPLKLKEPAPKVIHPEIEARGGDFEFTPLVIEPKVKKVFPEIEARGGDFEFTPLKLTTTEASV